MSYGYPPGSNYSMYGQMPTSQDPPAPAYGDSDPPKEPTPSAVAPTDPVATSAPGDPVDTADSDAPREAVTTSAPATENAKRPWQAEGSNGGGDRVVRQRVARVPTNGDQILVSWEGDDTEYLCNVWFNANGTGLYVESADGEFDETYDFSPTEDTWRFEY
mmetsp:Transcript_22294/g.46339  ORF Transcript_22294/g.46339 Transcript_22294/m.46339 type:complete len:161 (-) Transcript_22294:48-530(-)